MQSLFYSPRILLVAVGLAIVSWSGGRGASADEPQPAEHVTLPVRAALEGPVGDRIRAVIDQWVLTAPDANPGMLEMYRLRDRNPPYENPVPWAGEFAGKYLTSAVLLNRLVDDETLSEHLTRFVQELLATQDEDGYLGPFSRDQRLLGHWDLWGHYHLMLGLMLWHEDTGDAAALEAAKRIADRICATYLDGERRILDAGSSEMNMAVIHSLGLLYRQVGNERYLDLMRQIEQDWQQPGAGDYVRTGLAKVPFYRIAKPRWESLHPMQGMAELYRITGEEDYRRALLHHWHSIAETDVHNAGSFSTNEQAVGNPFQPGAIETCCTVAWMAYSVDALKLSGDSTIADQLELATYNAVLGYLHPSGRWCTYDTPMDGHRRASADSIVFQARPGTPELNCCSVYAPRGLGMIAQWALTSDGDSIDINYYGAGRFAVDIGDEKWTLVQETSYPAEGEVRVTVQPPTATERQLRLRIPSWSQNTSVAVNDQEIADVSPGTYLAIDRRWNPGDVITIRFDMQPRALRGDGHVGYRTSLYRGPLLLAYDQKFNSVDPEQLAPIDLQNLTLSPIAFDGHARFRPQVLLRASTTEGTPVVLTDYASAGAHGTAYRSWLDAIHAPPPPFSLLRPDATAKIPAGPQLLQWSAAGGPDTTYRVIVARDPAMSDVIYNSGAPITATHLLLDARLLATRGIYYWQVYAEDGQRQWTSTNGPVAFQIDGAVPEESDGVLLREAWPSSEPLAESDSVEAIALPASDRLVYPISPMPSNAYTFAAWFRADASVTQVKGLHQIVSAWCAPVDDPLRVSIRDGQLVAGVEQQGGAFQVAGGPVAPDVWTHVALVKDGGRMRLYRDGRFVGETTVPEQLQSASTALALGSNPRFSDPEAFAGAIAQVTLVDHAISEGTIFQWAEDSRPSR